MKVVYLTYGAQSGVVPKVSGLLRQSGCEVEIHNVADGLELRHPKLPIPRLTRFHAQNALAALRQFGPAWRDYYLRTDRANARMSERATSAISDRSDIDLILQSGLLFAPSLSRARAPFVLGILDNTHQIGKRGRRRPRAAALALSARAEQQEREAYAKADRIFAMSEHVKRSLVEDYRIPPERVAVTGAGPHVLPDDGFAPSAEKYGGAVVLMIASEFARKGGEVLLRAFEAVRRRAPQSRLVVVGHSDRRRLPGVEFRGRLPAEAVKRELERAAVVALPSLFEPFGLALLEGMAFGAACVGSDVEAIPEIIDDGRTGFVVPPGDAPALAERLVALLTAPALARTLGLRGREKYLRQFTWAAVMRRIAGELRALGVTIQGGRGFLG